MKRCFYNIISENKIIYLAALLFMVSFFKAAPQKIPENGFAIFKYPNNIVSSEGTMKNGKPDGYWKSYFPTGTIKSEGNRINYKLDSTWNFYDMFGRLSEKIEYKNGQKNGYHTKYFYPENFLDDSGIVISKELYLNDKKQGKSYFYHKNGKLKETVEYKNGLKDGKQIIYDEKEMIIEINEFIKATNTDREIINRYGDGRKKEGIWREYYENGNIKKEEEYKDGELNGRFWEYDENGNAILRMRYESGKIVSEDDIDTGRIKIREENYLDGSIRYQGSFIEKDSVGIHRWFDSLGNVKTAKIFNETGILYAEGIIEKDGEMKGEWKYFDSKGNVISKGGYVDNKKYGEWNFFYPSGNLQQAGSYNGGKKTGKWIWYYENGKTWREEQYILDLPEGRFVEYDIEGRPLLDGQYFEGEREGEWYYYVGDYIEKGKYVEGEKDGLWKSFYENNKLMFEGYYIKGVPDGKHCLYYDNGQKKEERVYVMGSKEKTWTRYDKYGNIMFQITYRSNQEYRINGQLIK